MLTFYFLNHKFIFDPIYAFQLLAHMWATEPVGTLSVFITLTSIIITLGFKLFDIGWNIYKDVYKEKKRAGKLRIELSAAQNAEGRLAAVAIISNTGWEPMVIRDVGYTERRLFGHEFICLTPPDARLPHTLNARDLIQVTVPFDNRKALEHLLANFQVKDSLGKLWHAPKSEANKAKRQLKRLAKAGAPLPAANAV
ncbi:MAG TPA: hypothetical protein V6C99_00890 [Oculatellaceae cyanobacterium]|jgi:hypothetical protein